MKNLVAILIVLVGTFTLNAQTNSNPELNGGTFEINSEYTDTISYDMVYVDLDNEIFMDLTVNCDDCDKDFKVIGEKINDNKMYITIYYNDGTYDDFSLNNESMTYGDDADNNNDYEYYSEFEIVNNNKYKVDFSDNDDDTLDINIIFDERTYPTIKLILKIKDTDGDGVADINDNCPNTTVGEEVDENGCSTSQTTSINTFSTPSNAISVYPNPVTNFLNVSGEFERVNVYDVSGKQLISTDKSRIDVSKLENGIYIVKVDGVSIKISKK